MIAGEDQRGRGVGCGHSRAGPAPAPRSGSWRGRARTPAARGAPPRSPAGDGVTPGLRPRRLAGGRRPGRHGAGGARPGRRPRAPGRRLARRRRPGRPDGRGLGLPAAHRGHHAAEHHPRFYDDLAASAAGRPCHRVGHCRRHADRRRRQYAAPRPRPRPGCWRWPHQRAQSDKAEPIPRSAAAGDQGAVDARARWARVGRCRTRSERTGRQGAGSPMPTPATAPASLLTLPAPPGDARLNGIGARNPSARHLLD